MIAELDGVKDVFIVPPMGDEGLVMGMPLDVMIRKRGFDDFLRNRRPLGTLYYGEEFPGLRPYLDSRFSVVATDDIMEKTVELLRADKVVGLFTKGMEYGPRALGARSILITPRDASINHTVNLRLNRSEFMPFAPYVRAERADDVFVIPPSSRAAMSYMTITCDVRPEWRDKIPAVVHVDGTARPQIIHRAENPFYYDILHRFEQATGLPCLVNTSFNAHEEPIINRPQEALQALYENRIDYLVADDVIVARR
jgi:carbamoyltransferase